MTQPKFAPVTDQAQVREAYKLPVARQWYPGRPADHNPRPNPGRPPNTGIPGPDQGYALLLADRFRGRLQLAATEHEDDVIAGVVTVALRRASLFGRAPVVHDLELVLHLFGYLEGAPEDLVETRERLFSGIAHDYWQQRDLADLIPETTLRLPPAEVGDRVRSDANAWRILTGLPG